ncbi:MAG: CAP domain-containing protein [Thermoleophilaceae bacterium]
MDSVFRAGARVVVAICCLGAVAILASCGGGGGNNAAQPPVAPKPTSGGTVGAQPTNGLLGPSETVGPGGVQVTGRGGPLTQKNTKPPKGGNGVAGGVACASASANPSGRNLARVSRAIVCLLNGQRAAAGLRPVHLNARLGRASRGMAKLMVSQHFFAHDTPSGRSLLDRVRVTGYVSGSWQLGENLAWGSGSLATAGAIVNGWMNSPGHKANILHAAFRDIGIGVRLGAPQPGLSGGATYVTDFGRHG